MRCPFCKGPNDRVVDSRTSADGFIIRRRRQCRSCGRRYTTYERVEQTPLRVIKKDGTREAFDRSKLLAGLLKACHKRPVPTEQLESLLDSVEGRISEALDREVPTAMIGEMIMQRLKELDKVAYVRFASVYRDFKDVSEFVEEVRPMLQADAARGATNEPNKLRSET